MQSYDLPRGTRCAHCDVPLTPIRDRTGLAGCLLAALLLLGRTGQAAPPPGQLLASQCFQCHGTNGQAVSGFESISGKSAKGMYEKLLEMSRRRPEGIMDLQTRAYTPTQLRRIAEYLASLPAEGVEEVEN